MIYKVLLIHGSFGNPYINWFPWLHEKLNSKGINCLIPTMPIGQGQNYTNWKSVLDVYRRFLSDELIVIGHSIGPAFLLNYLYDNPDFKVAKFISVSGFYNVLTPSEEYNQVNSGFFLKPLQDLINSQGFKNIKEKVAFYSTNDPYLDAKDLSEFANILNGKTIVSDTAGHFNGEGGYDKFEEILKYL